MRARAFTLIELMIAVAILGILLVGASTLPGAPQRAAAEVVVRERAQRWLEYEAGLVARGVRADREARRRLRELVPRGRLTREARGPGLVAVKVTWRSPRGRLVTNELVVMELVR